MALSLSNPALPGMGAISRDFGDPNGSTAEKVEISWGHSASNWPVETVTGWLGRQDSKLCIPK
jgi:hypothetical protein